MAAKKTEPTFTFVIDPEVTMSVRRMVTRPRRSRLGEVRTHVSVTETQWDYSIYVSGKKMPLFTGTDLFTDVNVSIWEAAAMVLRFHMSTEDNSIPEWFVVEELTTPQFRWFLDTARKMRSDLMGITLIGEMPGVYMVDEEGNETHFKTNGFPVDPDGMGGVSEGTQELVEARMDYTDPENEAPVTYPNIENSPFN